MGNMTAGFTMTNNTGDGSVNFTNNMSGPSNPYNFATPPAQGSTSGSGAPQANPGILAGAMAPAPQVSGSDNADKVAASSTSTYDPSQASGTDYTAANANAANVNVDAPQTVQGQIAGIINSGSPLMTMAQTQAQQDMNARGLTNSSLAVGAGQAALYQAAMPIAESDASTYAKAASQNASQQTDVNKLNAVNTTDANRYTDDTANNMAQFNTNSTNQAAATNAAATQRTSELNAGAYNTALQTDAQTGLQAAVANQDASVKQSAQEFDTASKAMLQNADAGDKLQLQQISANTQTNLAGIEAQYHNQMQTSQSMAQTYQQMISSVTSIMADPNMDAPSKQSAINNVTTLYNGALGVQQNISQLNLGSLLNPASFSAPTAGLNAANANPVTNNFYSGGATPDNTQYDSSQNHG